MKLQDYKKKALKNKEFRKEYESYDLAFEVGQMVVRARLIKAMTQKRLASLVKTKQPSIARLEAGQQLPSLGFLQKIAKAFGTYLLAPQFASSELNSSPISSGGATYTVAFNSMPQANCFAPNTAPSSSEEELIELNQLQHAY